MKAFREKWVSATLRRPRRRWRNSIKGVFREKGYHAVRLIPVVEDRFTFPALLKTVMKFNVLQT
jgi:hypothetical protein